MALNTKCVLHTLDHRPPTTEIPAVTSAGNIVGALHELFFGVKYDYLCRWIKKYCVVIWHFEKQKYPFIYPRGKISQSVNYFGGRSGQYSANFYLYMSVKRPPLWSSGQSFWLQIQRSVVRFPALPDFLSSSGSGTGSTQPREVNWGATWIKRSGSGPENRD